MDSWWTPCRRRSGATPHRPCSPGCVDHLFNGGLGNLSELPAMPRSGQLARPLARRRLSRVPKSTLQRRRLTSTSSDTTAAPSTCAAAAAQEVHRLFDEDIREQPPRLLRAFLEVQQLRGHELLAPDDATQATAGLHPLMVPLTRGVSEHGVDVVQGILRMPPNVVMGGDFKWALVEAPLVGDPGSPVHHYHLLAQDAAMHANRLAAEADATSSPLAADIAAVMEEERARLGESGGFIYAAGTAPQLLDATEADEERTKAEKKLRAYLLMKVGMFPDLLQLLSAEHLARGDETAAAVASARAADTHFGWGSGYWHQAKLMAVTGNSAQYIARAREQAQAALHCPYATLLDSEDDGLGALPDLEIWSDGGGFGEGRAAGLQRIAGVAGMTYDDLVADCHKRAVDKKSAEMKQGMAWPAQAAELRAVGLMDTVVVEGVPWPMIKETLAHELTEASLPGLAAISQIRLSAAEDATAAIAMAEASEALTAAVVDELPSNFESAMANVMPRTSVLFEQLPGGSMYQGVIHEPDEPSDADQGQGLVLRGPLGEKAERWEKYAKLCVDGFGAEDLRAVDAVERAQQISGAWEGQQTLVRAGINEGDIASMLFEHFAEKAALSDEPGEEEDGPGSRGGDLSKPNTVRALGFTRRLRAAVAEAQATESQQSEDADDADDEEPPVEKQPPVLSRTRSQAKRHGGAYSDHTRTGYVNTFSSYSAQHLGRAEYTEFLLSLGYEDCNDTRWRLECEAIGALEKRGPTLEQFRLLYTLHGRDAWEDAHAIWGDRYWEASTHKE